MNRITAFLVAALLIFVVGMGVQSVRLENAVMEAQRYRDDVRVMQEGIREYQTKDSLNVAQVEQLQLTMNEYEKYRSDDAELIKTLQIKNRSLQQVVTAQGKLMAELRAEVRDSLVYVSDTVEVLMRCVDIEQPYISLHGCIDGARFDGNLQVRDSLVIVESVRYKRFLGFLWRTKKVKDRHWDIVSRNPDMKITSFDVVTIVE